MTVQGVAVMLDVDVGQIHELISVISKTKDANVLAELEPKYKALLFSGKFEPAIPVLPPEKLALPIFKSLDATLQILPPGWTRVVDASAPEYGIDVTLFFDADFDEIQIKATHQLECVATCCAVGLAYRWVAQMAAAKRLVCQGSRVAYLGVDALAGLKTRPKMHHYSRG